MVTWNDAYAYANWLGHDLPSELEWEYAAKGFQQNSDIGPTHEGHIVANFWQGEFPYKNVQEDGFKDVALWVVLAKPIWLIRLDWQCMGMDANTLYRPTRSPYGRSIEISAKSRTDFAIHD